MRIIDIGPSGNDNRILRESGVTPPPQQTYRGGQRTSAAEFLHLYLEFVGNVTSVTIIPWYYSSIPKRWYEGESATFTPTQLSGHILCREEKVYFEIRAITGDGSINLWAGVSDDEIN
jgi:hypothetical protein